jgi:hypothetical protein
MPALKNLHKLFEQGLTEGETAIELMSWQGMYLTTLTLLD